MHKRTLRKPDGRSLHLYALHPISPEIPATSPRHEPFRSNPQFRWHPLRGEWVTYASHRQDRTFLPPKDYSPLAVTRSPDFPTEMPAGEYDAAVFENLFPSLSEGAENPPELYVPTRPGKGLCEVVVFTQNPDTALGAMPVERIDLVLQILAERTQALRGKVAYALPFENRGVEMGVTLHHPHGQIYGYPFVPPVPLLQLRNMAEHHARHGRGLLTAMIHEERSDGRRLVVDSDAALAFVPVCARYPYETWVMPSRECPFLHELDPAERLALADTLRIVLRKLDALWNRPMPYLMVLYQAPLDGAWHPGAHAHFQIYPAFRSEGRLKFLAGTELGGGMFVNDSLPEEKAAELRAVEMPA